MNLWMIRAGRDGRFETLALSEGVACVDFGITADVSRYDTKGQLRELLVNVHPEDSEARISNHLGQLFAFAHKIKVGDVVAMPLHSQPQIALGLVSGPYIYRNDWVNGFHTIAVDWRRPDVSRNEFQQDLLHSLGAIQSVCQVQRNNALDRVKQILAGKPDPGAQADEIESEESGHEGAGEIVVDFEEQARDQIRSHIEDNFKEHRLAYLVEVLLQAEGYVTLLSPPGPDGGADILARRGSLGLEGERLCVQVKSSRKPADVTVLRNLQGTMTTFKADEGLLVSWGGVNQAVQREARLSFFSVRLWDADDLIATIQRNYERLPESIRREIPLKRIWSLVLED